MALAIRVRRSNIWFIDMLEGLQSLAQDQEASNRKGRKMKQLLAVLLISSLVAVPGIYAVSQVWNHVETSLSQAFDPHADDKTPKDPKARR